MKEWNDAAELLGCWAWEMCVNRDDASGAYWDDHGQVKSFTDKHPLNTDRLIKHFRPDSCRDLIGLHALGVDNCGRWAAMDIDLHDGDTVKPDATRKFAVETYRRLSRFEPLLHESNGKGGYHIRVHFKTKVPGDTLFLFAKYMAQGWEKYFEKCPETFPKQPRIEEGKYGNWLRLIGRHHKRDFYPSVCTKKGWADGVDAVNHILGITGIPAERIQPELIRQDQPKPRNRDWEIKYGRGDNVKPWEEFDQKANWEEMLSANGWKPCGQSNHISYWTRPGKDDGISASLGHQFEGNVPLLFVFTSNADPFPPWKYYTPSAFFTWVNYRGDFRAANKELRSRGYGR